MQRRAAELAQHIDIAAIVRFAGEGEAGKRVGGVEIA
jgi:hypothetical protein